VSWNIAGWTPVQGPGRLWGGMRNEESGWTGFCERCGVSFWAQLHVHSLPSQHVEFIACLLTSVMASRCTEQWHISTITVWEILFVNVKKNCVMHKCIFDIFHKVHFYRHYYHKQSIITSNLHLAQCYLGKNMQSFMAAYCLHLTMIFQGFSYFKGFKWPLFTGG
jgi:hypothetical protein